MRSLYIHIPFCAKKCFYCSFVVSIAQEHRVQSYIESLYQEARVYQQMPIQSVFIGGGTPSTLDTEIFEWLVRDMKQMFRIHPSAEWTLEANPEDIGAQRVKSWLSAGVNRVSLGIQSLQGASLKYLGRIHDRQRALQAVEMLKECGVANVSVDMMYGFPSQSLHDLKKDLEDFARLNTEHVSVYALTIEERSKFYTQGTELQPIDVQAEYYDYVRLFLEDHGWPQYEVSNFSKAGFASLHNINYWEGGEYVGLGIGAHSFIDHKRYNNIDRLTEYIRLISNGKSVIAHEETLTSETRFKEALLLGLRMNKGVDMRGLKEKYQSALSSHEEQEIESMVAAKLLAREEGRLSVTDTGRLVLDEIAARLI